LAKSEEANAEVTLFSRHGVVITSDECTTCELAGF